MLSGDQHGSPDERVEQSFVQGHVAQKGFAARHACNLGGEVSVAQSTGPQFRTGIEHVNAEHIE